MLLVCLNLHFLLPFLLLHHLLLLTGLLDVPEVLLSTVLEEKKVRSISPRRLQVPHCGGAHPAPELCLLTLGAGAGVPFGTNLRVQTSKQWGDN